MIVFIKTKTKNDNEKNGSRCLSFDFSYVRGLGQLSFKQGMRNLGSFELKDPVSSRFFELTKEKFAIIEIVVYTLATLL